MAIKQKCFPSQSLTAEQFLQEHVKAYFISHGHLDHINGFILNSPNDKSGKTIFALNETIQIIQDDFFNNQAWADFGPHGLKVKSLFLISSVHLFNSFHSCTIIKS